MTELRDQRIVLGVGGGIAAYKAPALVRALVKAGAQVRVVLTRSAQEFVSPLALEAVSGNRVGLDLFEPGFEHEIGHIGLARWADAVVIAPATANLLARMRAGMADDLLTTVLLATTAPVVAFPAMNTQMWQHAAVRANVVALQERGVTVVDPDDGELACHEVGAGRQPDPDVIVAHTARALSDGALRGREILVSAGPTREYFDPVRFLSNPSSGRMGVAIAAAAFAAGADVTLVAGPMAVEPPPGVRVHPVVSAEQMRDAVHRLADCDALIMSAAVADWRAASPSDRKRKKTDDVWAPELQRTPDILAELSRAAVRPRVTVGFAAETDDVLVNARKKLASKGLDGIVANAVRSGSAFGASTNEVHLLDASEQSEHIGPAPKREVADAIVRWVARLLREKSSQEQP